MDARLVCRHPGVVAEITLVDPFTGEDLGMPLVGILDLVLADDPGALVIDFKTMSRSTEPLELQHEVQLTACAWLFGHTTPETECGLEIRSLVKTKTPKIEFHRFPAGKEAHFRRLFAAVRAYLDALDAGQIVYRPGLGYAMGDYCDGPCRSWAG